METTTDNPTRRGSAGPVPRLPPGAQVGGRWVIGDLIARTLFGELYRAVDAEGREASIRRLHPELFGRAEAIESLGQQMLVVQQLAHKNLEDILAFWVEDNQPFLATEYIGGSTLRDMLAKKRAAGRTFSVKGAYNVAAHVCNALTYTHGAIVHGGLTLRAVWVNAAGRVKLTEIGLVAALPAMERWPLPLGAEDRSDLASLAPEVRRATPPDGRSDIFSVGAMLYEMLTGRPIADPYTPPSTIVADLPSMFDEVLARCIDPKPRNRFADGQELKRALHAALSPRLGTSTSPPPPPTAPQASTAPARPAPVMTAPSADLPGVGMPRPAAVPPTKISSAAIPASFNVDSALATVDESQERWLIQKERLDFGPFRLSDVKHQIEKGQILGEHTIVDMESGERRRVKDHPLLRDFVRQAEQQLEENRRAADDAADARSSRRKVVSLLTLILIAVIGGGGGGGYYIYKKKPFEITKIVYKDRDGDDLLKGIEITMKVDPPTPRAKRTHHRGKRGPNGEFSDVTNLGDAAEEGGDETLSQEVVQKVMAKNFSVLKGCVLDERRRNASMKNIDMDFVIQGSGQVSAVRVNGVTASPFAGCMYSKMQSVIFPKFNGTKTHASFSLALK